MREESAASAGSEAARQGRLGTLMKRKAHRYGLERPAHRLLAPAAGLGVRLGLRGCACEYAVVQRAAA